MKDRIKGMHGGARKANIAEAEQRALRLIAERRRLEDRIGDLIDELTADGLSTEEFCRMSREVRFLEIRLEQLNRETWAGDECPTRSNPKGCF